MYGFGPARFTATGRTGYQVIAKVRRPASSADDLLGRRRAQRERPCDGDAYAAGRKPESRLAAGLSAGTACPDVAKVACGQRLQRAVTGQGAPSPADGQLTGARSSNTHSSRLMASTRTGGGGSCGPRCVPARRVRRAVRERDHDHGPGLYEASGKIWQSRPDHPRAHRVNTMAKYVFSSPQTTTEWTTRRSSAATRSLRRRG